jgi:DNA polymerase I-like protein with 3'-5' exonuclease and polymerase domains
MAYVHNYANTEKVDINKLFEDFKQFEEKKNKVEEKFYELYGKKVDIKNINYILNDDQDHRVNILDFKLIN